MNACTRLILAATILALLAPAQNVWDIPTPPTVGVNGSLPVFVEEGALATCDWTSIHRWVGLPGGPALLSQTPTGSQAMAEGWVRLNDSTAAYSTPGPDMVSQTADDGLVLVTGLPRFPTLVTTGITGLSTGALYSHLWAPVNDHTVVIADTTAQVFNIVRFDATGASRQVLSPPVPFHARGLGRLSDDAFIILGPGPDLTPQTGDDVVILLEGLSGPTPTATSQPLPAGTAPQRLVVTETGVGCCMQPHGYDDMLLTFVRLQPTGLAFDTLVVDPPMYGSWPGDYRVSARFADSIVVSLGFDVPPDLHYGACLVADVSTTPTVLGSWSGNGFEGSSRQIDEDEVAHWNYLSNTLVYTRYFAGGSSSLTLSAPSFFGGFPIVKPRDDTFVVVGEDANLQTQITLVQDLWSGNDLTTLVLPARPYPPVVLGPGMLAFSAVLPPYYHQFDYLRVLTLPTAQSVAPGVSAGQPVLVDISASPSPPVSGTPEVIQVTYPPSWNAAAVLGLSTGLAKTALPLGAPFAPGALLQLDLDSLAPQLLPLSGAGGTAQLTLDPWPLTTLIDLISGRAFYLQAAVYDGSGSYHLSPALMLVLH